MFIRRKVWDMMLERLEALEVKTAKVVVNLHPQEPEQHLECEKCGCLVGDNHVKGKPEIRTRLWNRKSVGEPVYQAGVGIYGFLAMEEYVHRPIYCQKCAPKAKRKKRHAA